MFSVRIKIDLKARQRLRSLKKVQIKKFRHGKEKGPAQNSFSAFIKKKKNRFLKTHPPGAEFFKHTPWVRELTTHSSLHTTHLVAKQLLAPVPKVPLRANKIQTTNIATNQQQIIQTTTNSHANNKTQTQKKKTKISNEKKNNKD